MTTQLIISSPDPNHNNVRIKAGYLNEDGVFIEDVSLPVELTDGESHSTYIHASKLLLISETNKT
jgi:hypothetical protein